MVPTKNASCYRTLSCDLHFTSAQALPSPHAPFGRSPLYFLRLMIAHELPPVKQFRTLGFKLVDFHPGKNLEQKKSDKKMSEPVFFRIKKIPGPTKFPDQKMSGPTFFAGQTNSGQVSDFKMSCHALI